MPVSNTRMKSMLFDDVTTYRTDYQEQQMPLPVSTNYQAKKRCMMKRPHPLKNIHTFLDWKADPVPFDLLLKSKDIVRANPMSVQKRYTKVPDLERKQIQMTRPRLVMSPGLSLDDIADEQRKILLDDIYMTSNEYTMHDALAEVNYKMSINVKAPFPGKLAPPNPITIPKLNLPYVSPEWRMDSITWDNKGLRAFSDLTKQFWLAKTPNCEECKNTADRNAMKKMKRKH